jgi:hypothetical protein
MTTLDVTILTDTDEPFVMSILNAMAEKKLIQLNNSLSSVIRPGSPMTVAALNTLIDKSEQSGYVSVEDAKKRLGL